MGCIQLKKWENQQNLKRYFKIVYFSYSMYWIWPGKMTIFLLHLYRYIRCKNYNKYTINYYNELFKADQTMIVQKIKLWLFDINCFREAALHVDLFDGAEVSTCDVHHVQCSPLSTLSAVILAVRREHGQVCMGHWYKQPSWGGTSCTSLLWFGRRYPWWTKQDPSPPAASSVLQHSNFQNVF